MSSFLSDLEEILKAANVQLESHNRWFVKGDRTCEAMGRFLAATASYISSIRRSNKEEVDRLVKSNMELAKRSSEESAISRKLSGQLTAVEHLAIGRGMEVEEIPEMTRSRILNTGMDKKAS